MNRKKRNSIRTFTSLAGALSFILMITGCHSAGTNGPTPQTPTTAASFSQPEAPKLKESAHPTDSKPVAPATSPAATGHIYTSVQDWTDAPDYTTEPYSNQSNGQDAHLEATCSLDNSISKLAYQYYLHSKMTGDIQTLDKLTLAGTPLQVTVQNSPQWIEKHPKRTIRIDSLRVLNESEFQLHPRRSDIEAFCKKHQITNFCLVECVTERTILDQSGQITGEQSNGKQREFLLIGRTEAQKDPLILELYWDH